MKNIKRISALLGVIILVLMYAATLIFAIIDHSEAMWLFKASIACTLVIPVFLYGILLFTRLSHKDSEENSRDND